MLRINELRNMMMNQYYILCEGDNRLAVVINKVREGTMEGVVCLAGKRASYTGTVIEVAHFVPCTCERIISVVPFLNACEWVRVARNLGVKPDKIAVGFYEV